MPHAHYSELGPFLGELVQPDGGVVDVVVGLTQANADARYAYRGLKTIASIASGASEKTITFSSPFSLGTIPTIHAQIQKASSSDDNIFVTGIIADNESFTAYFSDTTPNANYKLHWGADLESESANLSFFSGQSVQYNSGATMEWNGAAKIVNFYADAAINISIGESMSYAVLLYSAVGACSVQQYGGFDPIEVPELTIWLFGDDGSGNTYSKQVGSYVTDLQVGPLGSPISIFGRGVQGPAGTVGALVNGTLTVTPEMAIDDDNPIIIPHWHIEDGTVGVKLQVTRINGGSISDPLPKGKFTITSLKADGTIQTLDTSSVGWMLVTRLGG